MTVQTDAETELQINRLKALGYSIIEIVPPLGAVKPERRTDQTPTKLGTIRS
jgi:hypothetical protein